MIDFCQIKVLNWENYAPNLVEIGDPINQNQSCEKKFEKVDFFFRRKDNFDFEFPIKMSFFAKFQNYRREFPNSSFDRKFHTENL